MNKSLQLLPILALGAAVSLASQAQTEAERAAIEERIRPRGNVCLQGDEHCGAAMAMAAGAARSGQEVYDAACRVCHAAGVGGAPILGDVAAWAERIARGRNALYASSIQGIPGTGMIARGGCMNCSDDEVNAAVDYMVEASR